MPETITTQQALAPLKGLYGLGSMLSQQGALGRFALAGDIDEDTKEFLRRQEKIQKFQEKKGFWKGLGRFAGAVAGGGIGFMVGGPGGAAVGAGIGSTVMQRGAANIMGRGPRMGQGRFRVEDRARLNRMLQQMAKQEPWEDVLQGGSDALSAYLFAGGEFEGLKNLFGRAGGGSLEGAAQVMPSTEFGIPGERFNLPQQNWQLSIPRFG